MRNTQSVFTVTERCLCVCFPQGNCPKVSSINDRSDWKVVRKALTVIGFNEDEVEVRSKSKLCKSRLTCLFSHPKHYGRCKLSKWTDSYLFLLRSLYMLGICYIFPSLTDENSSGVWIVKSSMCLSCFCFRPCVLHAKILVLSVGVLHGLESGLTDSS